MITLSRKRCLPSVTTFDTFQMSFYYLSFGTHGARSFIAEIAIPYEHAIMFLSCSGLCLLIVCCLLVLAHSSVGRLRNHFIVQRQEASLQ